MHTFYYAPGSSALASHIMLEEVGAAYEAISLSIPKGEHLTAEFLAKNPKGRVPVLITSEGALSENPAILEYLATTHPERRMLPEGPFAQAQARSMLAYLCATVHIAFAHKLRGRRWATEEQALENMAAKVPENLADCAAVIEGTLGHGEWAMGAEFSLVDPYMFLMWRWMTVAGADMTPFPKLRAHTDAMMARSTVQRVLAVHGLP